jgi:SAM-dependent methyltransferase
MTTTAPDGSPIDLYLRLPSFGEADRIHELIPAGADVLELGCGVGRVTHELVRLGHPVTAVDESEAMLNHVRGADVVRARIEDLDLPRRFACVLLMSQLVNVPDDGQRRAFLRTCAGHVAADGIVLIERHDPEWQAVEGRSREQDGVAFALEEVRRDRRTVAATVRYEADGKTWRHPFVARLLDDGELDADLRAVGLRLTRALGEHRTWVEARPPENEAAKLV